MEKTLNFSLLEFKIGFLDSSIFRFFDFRIGYHKGLIFHFWSSRLALLSSSILVFKFAGNKLNFEEIKNIENKLILIDSIQPSRLSGQALSGSSRIAKYNNFR